MKLLIVDDEKTDLVRELGQLGPGALASARVLAETMAYTALN